MPAYFFDIVAVVIFFSCWMGISFWIESNRHQRPSVSKEMNDYRRMWMENMVDRELRMIDSMVQTSLLNGTAFFASTSILLVGGLLTILGATDTAVELISELPLVDTMTRTMWEIKVLLLIGVFTYAFFKFAWCYRLFIYVIILIGAAPHHEQRDQSSKDYAQRTAKLQAIAANHFNRGLRAYMFALAGISWFIHPLALISAALLVLFVVHRREFQSRSLSVLLAPSK
jgi:uncharacterized membrane protein